MTVQRYEVWNYPPNYYQNTENSAKIKQTEENLSNKDRSKVCKQKNIPQTLLLHEEKFAEYGNLSKSQVL
jgi:hypothetical protein